MLEDGGSSREVPRRLQAGARRGREGEGGRYYLGQKVEETTERKNFGSLRILWVGLPHPTMEQGRTTRLYCM